MAWQQSICAGTFGKHGNQGHGINDNVKLMALSMWLRCIHHSCAFAIGRLIQATIRSIDHWLFSPTLRLMILHSSEGELTQRLVWMAIHFVTRWSSQQYLRRHGLDCSPDRHGAKWRTTSTTLHQVTCLNMKLSSNERCESKKNFDKIWIFVSGPLVIAKLAFGRHAHLAGEVQVSWCS